MSGASAVRALGGPALPGYLDAVEGVLADAVGAHDGPVAEAGADTLRSGGKRLRPTLVFLAAPPSGRTSAGLAAGGAAVELVHMATLVHDDQIDASPLRRGRETVWRSRGRRVSTATGDYLFARAFGIIAAAGDVGAVRILSDACLALARGEIRQREQAGSPTTTVEDYLERCRLKTGRLFAAAAMLGGRAGGLAEPAVDGLGRFGEALGLAFQIADDVLDCDGQPDTTGKALGTDLLDGTVTLPLIVAARRDPAVRAVIARGAGPADVLPTLARVARCGAPAAARRTAERYAADALAELRGLDGEVDAAALSSLVRSAVDRDA